MIYGAIISLIFVVSFAYIVLVLANKESGNMKLVGQVLTVLIVLVALAMLYFGATGRGRCGMMGGKDESMECKSCEKGGSMMQNMCKCKDMKGMMQKGMLQKGMKK